MINHLGQDLVSDRGLKISVQKLAELGCLGLGDVVGDLGKHGELGVGDAISVGLAMPEGDGGVHFSGNYEGRLLDLVDLGFDGVDRVFRAEAIDEE